MKNRFSIIFALFLVSSVSLVTRAQSSDFLNTYFENQTPLNNNTFSLSLASVVIGNKLMSGEGENNEYFTSTNKNGYIINIPELLDANSLDFSGIQQNVVLNKSSKFNELILDKNLDWFNSNLPKIEILKNKLVTFNYNDGQNESFLFNVKKLNVGDDKNNHRNALQLEFVTEEMKSDNDENDSKSGNIVWRIFAIGNECYLALSGNQLNRIHLDLFSPVGKRNGEDQSDRVGVQVKRASSVEMITQEELNDYDNVYKTTGKGIYLARNKDKFMDGTYYLNPSELIFLFKLSQ